MDADFFVSNPSIYGILRIDFPQDGSWRIKKRIWIRNDSNVGASYNTLANFSPDGIHAFVLNMQDTLCFT